LYINNKQTAAKTTILSNQKKILRFFETLMKNGCLLAALFFSRTFAQKIE